MLILQLEHCANTAECTVFCKFGRLVIQEASIYILQTRDSEIFVFTRRVIIL